MSNLLHTLGTALVFLFLFIVTTAFLLTLKSIVIYMQDKKLREKFLTEGVQFEAEVLGISSNYFTTKVNTHDPNVINNLGDQIPLEDSTRLGWDVLGWFGIFPLSRTKFRRDSGIRKAKVSYTHPITRQKIIEHLYLRDSNDDRITKGEEQRQAYSAYNSSLKLAYDKQLLSRHLSDEEFRRLSVLAEDRYRKQQAIDSEKTHPYMAVKDKDGYQILNPPAPATGYLLNDKTMFIQRTTANLSYDWTTELE